jgi:hypothetical protein
VAFSNTYCATGYYNIMIYFIISEFVYKVISAHYTFTSSDIVSTVMCFTFSFKQSKSKNDVSGKAELEWPTNGGGKLTATGKANYESAQNFRIEVDIDSPALKLNKLNVVLANKPAKTAKTLQIIVKEADTSIINGR